MSSAPKGLRLHIGIIGRMNVGKSTLLNALSGQAVSITSEQPGTTTDVVEKPMEFLPIGPVVWLDTAGADDHSPLGRERIAKGRQARNRCDVLVLVCEVNAWNDFEQQLFEECRQEEKPVIIIVNKIDREPPETSFRETLQALRVPVIYAAAVNSGDRESLIRELKSALIRNCPEDFLHPPALVGDLLPAGGLAVFVVPIDLQAPKGRLILPQVQAIRDVLDHDASVIVVKERELAWQLSQLKSPPDLVVCDSQVVLKMVADIPPQIKCTTFSTLFARFKGDLTALARGVAVIDRLQPGDRILIAEACTHHALEDDIARVKIPRWLRQYTGMDLQTDVYAGHDYPKNLAEYRLVIHCGGCVINRREMLWRMQQAADAGVPVTNYGICISQVQGVLERILQPFPAALDALRRERMVLTGGA